ncbi:MAG: cell division protein ZapA [Burkholderiaceae bacterium]
MKQVEVTILGQSYLLACPEGGESLLQTAVASVDREMSGIRDAGKVKARERIAVLAALNLAYRLAEGPRGAAPPPPPAPPSDGVEPVAQAEASAARRAAAAQLDMLIARLDTALNDDGRLI